MDSNRVVLFEDAILRCAATFDMAVGRAVFQIENADRTIRLLMLTVVTCERRSRLAQSAHWRVRANEARASASEACDASEVLMLSEIAHLYDRISRSQR